MKKIIISVFLFLILSNESTGQSELPKCEGNNFTKWTNCFGKEKLKNGSYTGEYKKRTSLQEGFTRKRI